MQTGGSPHKDTYQMKTLHIVHLSTHPADDIRIFQKACKSEVAEGYQVTQIVCNDRDEIVDGVKIRALPPSKGRLSRMIGLSWKMYREAKRQNADIYQFHHPDLIPAGLLLKLSGKRVIYDTREFYPDKILSMRWIPVKLRPIISAAFGVYERITSAVWDHVLVADRYSARAFTGLPISVVPNYPLLTSVERIAKKQHSKRKLIYVGGLSEERGLLVMLKIAEFRPVASSASAGLHIRRRKHPQAVRVYVVRDSAGFFRFSESEANHRSGAMWNLHRSM